MRTSRIASKEDLAIVQHIASAAYHHTYVPILGQDQVDFMLKRFYGLGALSQQADQGQVFIIAQEDGEDIGFAAFGKNEPDIATYKLFKLYLLPEKQGTGVGRFLVNEVISHARSAGARSLQLNVNRFNKARGFYEKLGFVIKEQVDIPIGERYYMNDFVMEMDIQDQ